MRVFAGPNGSGKSTIIYSVRGYKTEGRFIDFGIYINADDIVNELKNEKFSFSKYKIHTSLQELNKIVSASGLINKQFTLKTFNASFKFQGNKILLLKEKYVEQIAQIVADFLRKKLLASKKKFSFETVFSHRSKLNIMKQASEQGYKVYLYFVSTNSPDINVERVALRVKGGGHNVPENKIRERYIRSLSLLYDAAQISYQTYFWDNSGNEPVLFASFKQLNSKKTWKIDAKKIPEWFIKFYSDNVTNN